MICSPPATSPLEEVMKSLKTLTKDVEQKKEGIEKEKERPPPKKEE